MQSLGVEPTFFFNEGCSQLDLILTNSISRVLLFNQVDVPAFSNHDLLFASLDFNSSVESNVIQYRDYNNINANDLRNAFNLCDWTYFYSQNDSDILARFLSTTISDLHDQYVPYKIITSKYNVNPWFNNNIAKAIVDRDLAYRQWKISNDGMHRNLFKRLRNKVTSLIHNAKKQYYSTQLNPDLSPKLLWKRLKTIGVGKSCSTNVNNYSQNDINEYFVSNYLMSENNCPFFPYAQQRSFNFEEISAVDVVNAVYEITSNAVGLDNISPRFLKVILPLCIDQVTFLFNNIIRTHTFPSSWKYSKIIPIKKKATGNSIENFRPISILSVLSKAFERIIKIQMCSYVFEYKLLNDNQSGYRPKHGTKTVMLKVLDDIGLILDGGSPVVLILLDFSKAFDTVSHNRLCKKLAFKFGFSNDAVQLIHSYLVDRYQAVYCNDGLSTFLPISSGVPQGSVLGPILFSLYVNDLPNILKYCRIHLYADDVQLYFNCSDLNVADITMRVNEDLDRIAQWSATNRLSLNVNKSYAMFLTDHVGSARKPDLLLNGTNLPFVNSASSLGVKIQENFEWDNFLAEQCGKIYGKLRSLQLCANFLNVETKLKLFKALILPHFISCDFLLTQASSLFFNKLKVALNSCIRFVFNLTRFQHVSHLQAKLIGCPFENFGKMRCCLLIFQLLKSRQPDYLFSKLRPLRNTRCQKFSMPRHRTAKYGYSFFVRGVATWNSLPNNLTLQTSEAAFRRECIEYFNCN